MLVGNKLDLHHAREISREEASNYAKRANIVYMETSALDATGVDDSFSKIIADIYLANSKRIMNSSGKVSITSGRALEHDSVRLDSTDPIKRNQCCT